MVKKRPMFGTIHNCWTSGHTKMRSGQSRAAEDRQQSVLFLDANRELAIKENPNKYATVQEKGIDPFLKTRCPFCLSCQPISKFLITKYDKSGNGKGFDRGRGKCPACGEGMQLKTLTLMRKWTLKGPVCGVKQFAAFIYSYRSSGVWQKKIKFVQFNSMLKSMGWHKDFYAEYKRLKGDLPSAEEESRVNDLADAYEEAAFNEGT